MLRLAEQLQEYDKMLSSLPPLALIAYAAPFAMKSETASTFFVRTTSPSDRQGAYLQLALSYPVPPHYC